MHAPKTGRELRSLRSQIEDVDREILGLLRRRMGLAEAVAMTKLASAVPFRDRSREELVLQRVRRLAAEMQLDAHEIERFYRLIMDMSVARQHAHVLALETVPVRVAYQGVEGSHAHQAAQARYAGRPGGTLLAGYDRAREAVAALREGQADVAFLAIESTTAGSLNDTYELLASGGVTITAESFGEVTFRLLGLPGARVEDVRHVLAEARTLARCERFLQDRLPLARLHVEPEAAVAARKARESNDPGTAALAGDAAAVLFGLEVLVAEPHPSAGETTRYVELALDAAPCPEGVAYKTSVMFALEDKLGALGELLTNFAKNGVNLLKLESRPIPGSPWQYRFYLDVEGHASSSPVAAALGAVGPLTSDLRVLGTYPKGT